MQTDKNQLSFDRYILGLFENRCHRNPQYSLRAFARDLGVSSANLSKAMSGTRGFSKDTLEQISTKLALTQAEKTILVSLCEKKFSRSKKCKEAASIRLKQALVKQTQIADENITLISDWYHLAILALADCREFNADFDWMADRLGVHEKLVRSAVERLVSVGALKKENNQLASTGNLFVDPKGIPSAAVKEFHHQILKKADLAIEMQGLEDRDVSSVLFSFDKANIKKAKEKIKKFREEFEAEFGPVNEGLNDEVYCLSTQFFQITKINSQGDKK